MLELGNLALLARSMTAATFVRTILRAACNQLMAVVSSSRMAYSSFLSYLTSLVQLLVTLRLALYHVRDLSDCDASLIFAAVCC